MIAFLSRRPTRRVWAVALLAARKRQVSVHDLLVANPISTRPAK